MNSEDKRVKAGAALLAFADAHANAVDLETEQARTNARLFALATVDAIAEYIEARTNDRAGRTKPDPADDAPGWRVGTSIRNTQPADLCACGRPAGHRENTGPYCGPTEVHKSHYGAVAPGPCSDGYANCAGPADESHAMHHSADYGRLTPEEQSERLAESAQQEHDDNGPLPAIEVGKKYLLGAYGLPVVITDFVGSRDDAGGTIRITAVIA